MHWKIVKRPKRQAAIKFNNKLKQMLPCLNIKLNKKKQLVNLHGWKYEDWLKDIDDDPYYESATPCQYNSISSENITTPVSESEDSHTDVLTPFGQFLNSLDDLSLHHHNDGKEHSTVGYDAVGMLGMFPPVEEHENMAWDDSTTPPALRNMKDEDIEEELNSVLTDTKLFNTDDDDDPADIDILTSTDSDDVFFDDSILEVSIGGRRRFSRNNPVRKQLGARKRNMADGDESNSDTEDNYGGDEKEGSKDEENGPEDDEENNKSYNAAETDDNYEPARSQRQKRRVSKMDYALFHSEGVNGKTK